MRTFVYDFADGDKDMRDLLGGKGANLAEMTRMGLPVPPGFTITTEACRAYLKLGEAPEGLMDEVAAHLRRVEEAMGRRLGDAADPLLLSVRSGGKFSMPGMMDTILDIGLNDTTVHGLAAAGERFAWDCYRRLIAMYGATVAGVPHDDFERALAERRRTAGVTADSGLGVADLRDLVEEYRFIYLRHTGEPFPQDPRDQLTGAVLAVFRSWNTERAEVYRRAEHIPDDLGTAVNVMAMVYGNRGPSSGTGVAFTRDPATGARGVYGDYLPDAQGEDVVAGVRDTLPLHELAHLDPRSFGELTHAMDLLERRYRDLCDIEFTIEDGRLWLLQTRVGKRTAAAAFTVAAQLVDEGVIDLDEALRRVDGAGLARLMFPRFDLSGGPVPVATGVPASPGAATGRAVFDARRAAAAHGPVVLVREETNPDDLPGMIAARGILTGRGGKTSHAAVVARGMGRACVCGAPVVVDEEHRELRAGDVVVREGDLISVDGATGEIYLGELPVRPSPVAGYFDHGLDAESGPLVTAVHRLVTHADAVRRLEVRANADTPQDAARARRFGAAGIGLCRTEHMFLGERRALVERLIVAEGEQEVEEALDALLPLQRADFIGILTEMDGLPVTIRLLDPPLHEFLPSLEDLLGATSDHERKLLAAVRRLHESNPMLGLRGVRLGLVVPGLFAMQVRAIAEAAAERVRAGGDPRPEIMVPLVGDVRELSAVKAEAERVLAAVKAEAEQVPAGVNAKSGRAPTTTDTEPGLPAGGFPCVPVGTMIEVPRAALTAGEIAGEAEFFSFGTNDLTQMTWGFSRDDVEGTIFPAYMRLGILTASPFETIDRHGVGRLVELAVAEGRAARPDLTTGVCGEHGGDPASVWFFHETDLDYVSCSPFRVPVARLEAGRAALPHRTSTSDTR
ncbi:pyruvate, phosphate dikinase [Sphaerisporangium rubeum]|uniref:Pyruvate, phosphate dikinase n=1 Tax=Sphaerisporangium rubeum TaxID=321317 RepID=A0A7X0I8W9_9ACTN|nr:pyruvate, phosphate dikinase [Sphaerisporangium rubeum]MBB6470801.1 pyruvate,orthophosphate dikinase [Sphaerisporangium rubeum]